MYVCTRRGEEGKCLNRTNRPSVCMYQGCVGSELEVVSNTPSVYTRMYASMSQGSECGGGV